MNLTIDELLAYTDEERSKWERWFASHGNDALKIALPMDVHPTVGALIIHCFWAELFYALWMRGEILTEERIKRENESLAPDDADKIFRFGTATRKAMREFSNNATESDWERNHDFEARGFRLEGSARKLVAHILIHEIRHFAQVAIAVRQSGQAPPGDHDLCFSESFGPLARRV